MNRKSLRCYILLAFVLVIYTVAVIPFPKTNIFWIAFAFSMIAIFSQLYTVHIFTKRQTAIQERIYDFPLLRVSVLYMIVQIGASLLFMSFSQKVPAFAAVLAEVILLSAAVMAVFAVQAAGREAIRQDKQLKRELSKMERLLEQIKRLIAQSDGEKTKGILWRLAEEVRYSNPVSNDRSEEIEGEITQLFSEIEERALDDDSENVEVLCDRMRGLLRERDRICRHSG